MFAVIGALLTAGWIGALQSQSAQVAPASAVTLAGQTELARLVDLAASRLGVAITYDESVLKVAKVVIRQEGPMTDEQVWLLTNRLLGEQGLCLIRGTDRASLAVAKVGAAVQMTLAEDVDLNSFVPGRMFRDESGRVVPGFRKFLVRLSRTASKDAVSAVQLVLSKPAGSVTESEASGMVVIADLTPYADAALAVLAQLERVGGGASIEYMPLKNLDPARLVALTKQLTEKIKSAGGRELRGELLPGTGGGGGPGGDGGAAGDQQSGGVLVIAPATQQAEWRALIARLDTREPVERRTYAVTTFGLREVAALIEQTVRNGPPGAGVGGFGGAGGGGGGGGGGGDDRWRVITDDLTGSLIIDATPGQHVQVEELLVRLQNSPGEARRPVRTFKIRNRAVREMQQLLMELLRAGVFDADLAQSGGGGERPGTGAASSQQTSNRALLPGGTAVPTLPGSGVPNASSGGTTLPNVPSDAKATSDARGSARLLGSLPGGRLFDSAPVALTADEATNTLIAVGESRVLAQIESLLPTLDVRQPQVMLEAYLVSLNESQSIDFGVELERLRVSGDTLIKLSSLFGLSTASVSGAAGGGSRSVPDRTGFTGSVLNPGEFSVILRAVEGISRGRSLSRPKVLVGNNQQATFNSVLQQPFASTNASTTVATTAFGGTQDAGTTISVRPQIAEGDHLVLTYSVSLSAFVGAATNANLPPPRQQNSVSSVSTIPDGYTVVVGGLETTTEGDSTTQVPIVGNIPILGELFKNRSKTGGRTRFFVFLRASVLRGIELDDLKYLSAGDSASAGLGSPDGAPEIEPRLIR